jgi:hypothetical protein
MFSASEIDPMRESSRNRVASSNVITLGVTPEAATFTATYIFGPNYRRPDHLKLKENQVIDNIFAFLLELTPHVLCQYSAAGADWRFENRLEAP